MDFFIKKRDFLEKKYKVINRLLAPNVPLILNKAVLFIFNQFIFYIFGY